MLVAAAPTSLHEPAKTFSSPPSPGKEDREEIVPWREKAFSIEEAFWKMIKNQNKSIDEHLIHYNMFMQETNPYIQPTELSRDTLPWNQEEEATPPLQFSYESHSDVGKTRPQNEDAHFYLEWDEGVLAGVFDGHLGKEVSNFASNKFKELFPTALKKAEGNVHTTFERVIHQIHREVAAHSEWNQIGSAAVICYIDKKTHWVYTATLSDCEANIYRKKRGEPRPAGQGMIRMGLRTLPSGRFELTGPKGPGFPGEYMSIPLSPQRHWLSNRDQQRLRAYLQNNKPDLIRELERKILLINNDPKKIYSHILYGVNTPRAIGDVDESGTPECPLVSTKSKITAFQLHAGDFLILTCDGLKDFLSEEAIVQIIRRTKENLSSTLVKAAIANMNDAVGGDNVSVIAIKVS